MRIPRKFKIPRGDKPVPPATRLRMLPPEQQDRIVAYLDTHCYKDGLVWIATEFGIQNCRYEALRTFRFWRMGQVDAETDLDKQNRLLERFEQLYKSFDPEATREKVRELGLTVFMADAAESNNRRAFLEVLAQDLKERDLRAKTGLEDRKLSLAERRLALLEKKAAQADEAAAVVRSQLTQEEKQRRLDVIFGVSS